MRAPVFATNFGPCFGANANSGCTFFATCFSLALCWIRYLTQNWNQTVETDRKTDFSIYRVSSEQVTKSLPMHIDVL